MQILIRLSLLQQILDIFTGDFSDAEVFAEFLHKDEKSKLPHTHILKWMLAHVFVNNELIAAPGEFGVIVPTGMKWQFLLAGNWSVRPRSGLSHKTFNPCIKWHVEL